MARSEPAATAEIPGQPGRTLPHILRPQQWEIVNAVTVVLTLLIALPARLVFAPLGAAGRPGELLCVACLLWWLDVTLVQGRGRAHRDVVGRRLVTWFAFAILISYLAATIRPIDDTETRAADRGLLHLAAWAGILLLTAEGMRGLDRLVLLLRRFTLLGTIMGAIGIIQALSGIDVTAYIAVPGLSTNEDVNDALLLRNGLNRPASTASHPIEFGVVMATLVPIALYQAFQAPEGQRFWPRVRVLVIATGAVMSVSRSAILGMLVAGILLLPTYPPRRRKRLITTAVCFLVVVRFLVHGLLGTILQLFTAIGSDSSTQSRTGAFAAVGPFIESSPIFGRGFSTLLPSIYILDDQYLGALIEIGAFGLLSLITLLAAGVIRPRRAAQRLPQGPARDLGMALSASAAVLIVSFATFDALGFSMIATLTFFILGCCFAYARLVNADPTGVGSALEIGPDAVAEAPPGRADPDTGAQDGLVSAARDRD